MDTVVVVVVVVVVVGVYFYDVTKDSAPPSL
jgi:hypothetical protein